MAEDKFVSVKELMYNAQRFSYGDSIEIYGRAYERVVHCLDCPYYEIAKDYCAVNKTYKAKDDYCSTPKKRRTNNG